MMVKLGIGHMTIRHMIKRSCCAGMVLIGLSIPTLAYGTDDVLGQFLEKQLFLPTQTVEVQQVSAKKYPVQTLSQQVAYVGPLLDAEAALIMNAHTGQVLYQKNMDDIRSIASISKLMAAMVLLDAGLNMNDLVTITEAEIDRLKKTTSRLSIGTTLTRQQLLHLGLMSSENRAIHALGRTYPGGMSAFVAAMNQKAAALGMVHTRFVEPTGLDPRNVSTARDLSIMVRAASKYAPIRQLSTSNFGTVYTSARKVQNYRNSNALVREGLWDITLQKTGYIREAGRSMVLQAQMENQPIVIVVLGSTSTTTRVNDVRALGNMVYQQAF